MLVHRFREQLRLASSPASTAGQACAFVPCPMFALMPASQQARVQEIYRLAAELTQEQLAPPRIPEFSLN